MATWTQEELTRVGDAEELDIGARRPDGSLRPFVTIWVVRSGDSLYVRSVKGPDGVWYQGAVSTRTGGSALPASNGTWLLRCRKTTCIRQ